MGLLLGDGRASAIDLQQVLVGWRHLMPTTDAINVLIHPVERIVIYLGQFVRDLQCRLIPLGAVDLQARLYDLFQA